jgi:hypothetical protein
MEFLHTFALLPQSIYPADLRDALIRHTGGDLYGTITAKALGSFSIRCTPAREKTTAMAGISICCGIAAFL